ncbi:MAG: hypothetical protein HOE82_05720 [Gammaproteobacteria bacterium]|jgi:hypothetical protein|nr:hypothetical protein [Gammaproteobacteria bacterium]
MNGSKNVSDTRFTTALASVSTVLKCLSTIALPANVSLNHLAQYVNHFAQVIVNLLALFNDNKGLTISACLAISHCFLNILLTLSIFHVTILALLSFHKPNTTSAKSSTLYVMCVANDQITPVLANINSYSSQYTFLKSVSFFNTGLTCAILDHTKAPNIISAPEKACCIPFHTAAQKYFIVSTTQSALFICHILFLISILL